jgi:dethiobiotin synthetase
MRRGIFVTGTDTGVGKTVACCALLHAIRSKGIAAYPFKPIAAGASEQDGVWANDDTRALIAAAGLAPNEAERVTPLLLRDPIAPSIAAERDERIIDLEGLRDSLQAIEAPFIVAEGVGGFMVPLGSDVDTVDLCRILRLPVVLVVGMRLGCLNHALLTASAIHAAGLPLAGWIANHVDPAMAAQDENLEILRGRLGAPLLGRLPHCIPPMPQELSRFLDVAAIL